MKIIIEGTAEDIQNVLGSIGIPKNAVFDDGEKFVELPKFRQSCAITCRDQSYKGHGPTKGKLNFALDCAPRDDNLIKAQAEYIRSFGHLKETIGEKISDFLTETETQPTNPVISLKMMAENASKLNLL